MKGFVNNGNSCFFNTSLKALLTVCHDLVNHECEIQYSTFTHLFFSLLKAYYDPTIRYIDPRPLLDVFREIYPQFIEHEPHDTQECILFLIDILERDVPLFKKRFYGIRENQVIHPQGKNVSTEAFSMYIIDAQPNTKLTEQLDKSFKWTTIENYGVYHLATKRSLIRVIPEVFMISFDAKSDIEVPENFILNTQYMELVYSCMHHGDQQGGHYVCMTKHENNWILHDDMTILKLDKFPTKSGHHVLIYTPKTLQS